MAMIRFIICTLLFLSSSGLVSLTQAAAPPARPNIVIVMTDDQGLGDFSFTGNPVLKTPNFDAFARESVRLTDFHVAPMCTPTRGQLLTGLSALRKRRATSVTAGGHFCGRASRRCPSISRPPATRRASLEVAPRRQLPSSPDGSRLSRSNISPRWGQLQSTVEFDRR